VRSCGVGGEWTSTDDQRGPKTMVERYTFPDTSSLDVHVSYSKHGVQRILVNFFPIPKSSMVFLLCFHS